MRSLFRILPVIVLSAILDAPVPASAQDPLPGRQQAMGLQDYILNELGPDQNLINGIQYYNKYQAIQNHPYYDGEECLPGSVVISGRKYDDVMISYDLYAQNLVLRYENKFGAINKIIIDSSHIDAFSIGDRMFRKLSFNGGAAQFYQLIDAGGATCYIQWRKRKLETVNDLQYAYYFTGPERSYYLESGGEVRSFSGRRGLINLFPGVGGRKIRRYMWRHEIYFRSMTTGQLTGLLEYIDSIRKSGE